MRTDAKLLWQAVKNATLYSAAKSFSGGVEFSVFEGRIELTSCDNFVAQRSVVNGVDTDSYDDVIYLEHRAVGELEKTLRGLDDSVEVWIDNVDLTLDIVYEGVEINSIPHIPCPDSVYWDMLDDIFRSVSPENVITDDSSPFEIGGQRLAKLSQLEPKNKFPISFGRFRIGSRTLPVQRYGPETIVVIMPLDRELLGKTYDNLEEVVW